MKHDCKSRHACKELLYRVKEKIHFYYLLTQVVQSDEYYKSRAVGLTS